MPTTIERPTAAGVYLVRDAALLVSATTPSPINKVVNSRHPVPFTPTSRHLYRWVREGLAGHYLKGLKGEDVALTFADLISMRMIAIMRRIGMQPKHIHIAHDLLVKDTGWPQPFAMEPVWAYGIDLVIKRADIPYSVNHYWQQAFEFIDEYLVPIHDLIFDENKMVQSWEPYKGVMLNPNIRFGEPCIDGTRIPTDVIWGFNQAGDSPQALADAYDLPLEAINAALSWEQKLVQAA